MKVDSDPAVRSFCPFTLALSDEEVTALVVDNSVSAGFAGYDAGAQAGFACGDAPRAVLSSSHRCSSWYVDDVPVVVRRVHRQSVDFQFTQRQVTQCCLCTDSGYSTGAVLVRRR